jgi:hypothetical protein
MIKTLNVNRTDYLGLAALLLLALLNFSSTGFVRGGDDDGSGIGGTGRMTAPDSGSGFGGTGFKPFVGMNGDNELEILRSPAQLERAVTETVSKTVNRTWYTAFDAVAPTPVAPLASPVAVVQERAITTDSSAIDITEQIQRAIDSNALYFHRQQQSALAVLGNETREQIEEFNGRAENETIDSTQLAAVASEGEAVARMHRPERIHRPELPPVQRIQPIRPASILPPRIKPLRL